MPRSVYVVRFRLIWLAWSEHCTTLGDPSLPWDLIWWGFIRDLRSRRIDLWRDSKNKYESWTSCFKGDIQQSWPKTNILPLFQRQCRTDLALTSPGYPTLSGLRFMSLARIQMLREWFLVSRGSGDVMVVPGYFSEDNCAFFVGHGTFDVEPFAWGLSYRLAVCL